MLPEEKAFSKVVQVLSSFFTVECSYAFGRNVELSLKLELK